MANNSNDENYYSAIIIEIANSVDVFLEEFDFQNEEEEIEAFWNKLAGAAIGAVLSWTYDSFKNGSDGLTYAEWKATITKGAIVGAARSL